MKTTDKKKPVKKTAKKIPTPRKDRQFYKDLICTAIATSERGLVSLVRAFQKNDPKFPDVTTVMKWLREDEIFSQHYAQAREAQADYMADQIVEISDDDSLDMAFKEDGTPFVDKEHIQRSKLRVDARKWVASKLKPKKYGDKLEQTMQNPDGSPISINVVFKGPDAS